VAAERHQPSTHYGPLPSDGGFTKRDGTQMATQIVAHKIVTEKQQTASQKKFFSFFKKKKSERGRKETHDQ
jgi:hypothetical protein